jgi:hypothetical protein
MSAQEFERKVTLHSIGQSVGQSYLYVDHLDHTLTLGL